MRARLVQTLVLFGSVTILVLAANTVALAANGKGFLLGKANKASKVTTLQRTKPGPALSLKATSGPPLAVNNSTKVARLNADAVDGRSASDFAPSSVTGDLAALNGRVTAAEALTPIAAGFVYADGTRGRSRGIGAVSYGGGSYTIEITGESYFYTYYAPTVTPVCSGATFDANSVGGKLLVRFADAATGAAKQCAFALSVVELPN